MSTARKLWTEQAQEASCGPLMASIRKHEGFKGDRYLDSLGKPTIGVGTLLPLTEDEGMLLAFCRMTDHADELGQRLYDERHIPITDLPWAARMVLVEMAFQLGVPKLMRFRRMLAAIAKRDWKEAAAEALDSKWARSDSPARAQEMAAILRGLA